MKTWFKNLNITGKILFFVTLLLIIWEVVSLIVPSIWTISEAMSRSGRQLIFIPYVVGVLSGHWFFMRDRSAGMIEIIILIVLSVLFLVYSILIWSLPLADAFSGFLINNMGIVYIFGLFVGALCWFRKRGK